MELFADGLYFPECPRWHNGGLWISDMRAGAVVRFDPDGNRRTVVELDGDEPGGIGWLPDGRMLVVGMHGRRIWHAPTAPAWWCTPSSETWLPGAPTT